jgi:hypothetical protein
MSRSTDADFPGAFRVVTTVHHRVTKKQVGKTEYTGPYQTIGAAKGMLTRLLWNYNYYGNNRATEKFGHIEEITGPWKEVTA